MAVAAEAVERKKSYHHGDLRTELLSVVRDLVEEKGPDGFSIAQAARLAGVSTAAPYKHFKDKSELLCALVMEGMDRMLDRMSTETKDHDPNSIETIAAMGKAYIEFARSEPGIFRLMFGLTDGHDKSEEVMQAGRNCFESVIRAVARYQGKTKMDEDAERRAYYLWTAVHGHAFLNIDDKMKALETRPTDWEFLIDISKSILAQDRLT